MRIVFMGTTHFAAIILQKLIYADHKIISVYTKLGSSVYSLAQTLSITLHTPASLKNYSMNEEADAAVVAAYGLIIPTPLLKKFIFGYINVHPSILPKWRGAAPVERCIMAGETVTGVSIMQLDAGLDTGDILGEAHTIQVTEDDTGESLTIKLAHIGADALVTTLANIANIKSTKQDDSGATYAHKIEQHDEKIVWSDPGQVTERKIRALYPNPCAYCELNGVRIKIVSACFIPESTPYIPGTIINKFMDIALPDGILRPQIVQKPGGKRMQLADFLRGFTVPTGSVAQ